MTGCQLCVEHKLLIEEDNATLTLETKMAIFPTFYHATYR